MIDVDYGHVRIKLADLMAEQNISINKLAFRAEMQRTQSQPYGLTTGSAGGLDKPLQGIFRCRL